jgi:regulator of cell morphogenesis and NO signaling
MKITDALREEHGILRAQLDAFEDSLSSGADFSELRAKGTRVAEGLLSHAHIEDEVLFPALDSCLGGGMGPLAVMRQEHLEIEGSLGRIGETQSLGALRDLVLPALTLARQHFLKEDEMLFPMAEQALDEGDLEQMTARFRERRNTEPLA